MSLYQCERCGCKENTALGWYWLVQDDRPEFNNKKLCSACGPKTYDDGETTGLGQWHGKFERVYFTPGSMETDENGNLIMKQVKTGK